MNRSRPGAFEISESSAAAVAIGWRKSISAAGLLVAVATLVLALNIAYQFLISYPGDSLRDFGSFYESGRAALESRNPYAIHEQSYRVEIKHFTGANPNLNPPASLLVMAPLSLLDPAVTYRLLWWGSLGGFLAVLFYLARSYQPTGGRWLILWALSLPGFWGTLFLGQIYVPLMIAASAAWILQDRGRLVEAGLLIGLVAAFKPNFLVWPALLFMAGHRRTALAALFGFAALSAAPILLFGADVYRQWWEMLIADNPGRLLWVTNMSVIAYAGRLDVPWLGRFIAAALLLGSAWWAWRYRPDRREAGAAALFIGLLASPVAWIHYALFLLPPLFSVRWSRAMMAGALLLATPRLVSNALFEGPTWVEVTFGSVYIWGLLTLAVPLAWQILRRDGTAFARMAVGEGR
ncbi:MAG: DUF2029 domain-containing protein [Rhodospirillales bacterium]|nr:MAG: DUF2029 domain-containing protein [Rhodospirillales bacterium]